MPGMSPYKNVALFLEMCGGNQKLPIFRPKSLSGPRLAYLNGTPEKQPVIIEEVPDDEDPDVMLMAPWRRTSARFFSITSIIPALLDLRRAHIQAQILIEFGKGGIRPLPELVLAWLYLAIYFSSSRKHLIQQRCDCC
jgi:hypothetical protein